MKERVIIAGSLAQKPGQGGHTWQFLQYLLGFKQLGWDVLFVDCLHPVMCVDGNGRPASFEESVNLKYFLNVMERFGLEDDFALLYDGGERTVGRPKDDVVERTRGAAFLLNVMGFLQDEKILGAAPRLVFLDTDPGYGQMWQELGLARMFDGYDAYVTIAENLGKPGCGIPTCGLDWITWRQPIVLEKWPALTWNQGGPFTSIGSWRGPYGPIDYRGRTYGLRAHEFRKFISLPRETGEEFEIALEIDPGDETDLARLRENGWKLVDPRNVAADPWVYRAYLQRARAEIMVARNMYVDTNSGWFSERSICFLASGCPVLAQDTGIRSLFPMDKGLVPFSTLEEAVAGVEAICSDYRGHARAAREIAEACFDSDKVLDSLVAALGSKHLGTGAGR